MKKIFSITTLAMLLVTAGCKKDSEFLNIDPIQVLPQDVVFSDPALALSALGDLYNRAVDFSSLDNGWASFADFSESFPSENGSYYIVQRTGWDYGSWGTWDYSYVRDMNLFLERDSASTALLASDKTRFAAECRFLRANYYFEMVKRMGGVPLVTSSLTYDYKGDATYLQYPRSTEAAVYDFVISEAEAIKNSLPSDPSEKSRATKAAALAMESRAALYAASIARYNSNTPAVTLPGGEIGISSSLADAYYTKALNAAKEVLSVEDGGTGSAGGYKLYQVSPDLSTNFANIFLDKSTVNVESIYIEDFKAGAGKTHGFTTNDQPYSISDEGGDAGRLDPSLNLVESFEKLDNTFAPLPTTDTNGKYIYYNTPDADSTFDIFKGRDARLAGTVLLPNGLFKGKNVDIWAGYWLAADSTILTSDEAGNLKTLPGGTTAVQVVGKDGPINGLEFRTQSGFYVRKWLDPTVGSGRRGRGSDVPFVRYRYAELLLNAAEASFELGQKDAAANYMNKVRARAGLTIPLTAAQITFDRIVHERRVELAFEGHYLFDMKRWRLAHVVWDGNGMSLTDLRSNIGSATKRNTQPWGLWPYKVFGGTNNGKWIFQETLPGKVTGSNLFRFGNYYSRIDDNIIAANPKITRQPNQ